MQFGTYHFHPTVVLTETRPCIVVSTNPDDTVNIIVFLDGKDDATQGVVFKQVQNVAVGSEPYQVEIVEVSEPLFSDLNQTPSLDDLGKF